VKKVDAFAFFLTVTLFSTASHKAFAEDMWSFANDWEQRNSSVKSKETNINESQRKMQDQKKNTTSEAKKPQVSNVKKQKKKSETKQVPQNTNEQKKFTPTEKKQQKNKDDSREVIAKPQNENKTIIDEPKVLTDENVKIYASQFGLWLKEVVKTVKATPEEKKIHALIANLKESNSALSKDVEHAKDNYSQQQHTLESVQRRLKELQSPSLPVKQSEREDFAAGMAAGYSLSHILDVHEKQGASIERSAFLYGINEAMQDGKRLQGEEFENLLASANLRINDSRERWLNTEANKDAKWLKKFTKKSNIKRTDDNITYHILYSGDRKINDNEEISIALSRYKTDGTLLEDTDIENKNITLKLANYTSLLRGVLINLGLHGEAEVAMPVDENGLSSLDGRFLELWRVRIISSDHDF